jgi:hypothetical protein
MTCPDAQIPLVRGYSCAQANETALLSWHMGLGGPTYEGDARGAIFEDGSTFTLTSYRWTSNPRATDALHLDYNSTFVPRALAQAIASTFFPCPHWANVTLLRASTWTFDNGSVANLRREIDANFTSIPDRSSREGCSDGGSVFYTAKVANGTRTVSAYCGGNSTAFSAFESYVDAALRTRAIPDAPAEGS